MAPQTIPQLKRRLYKDPDQQMKHLKYLKKKEQIIKERIKKKEQQSGEDTQETLNDDINVEVSSCI